MTELQSSKEKLSSIKLVVSQDVFPLAEVFTISRGSRTEAAVIAVELQAEGFAGRGECVPYARYGETLESVEEQIRSVEHVLGSGLSRLDLQQLLPAGAARNAIDCALWDLQAKQQSTTVWQLAGLPQPQVLTTAYTLSLAAPADMCEKAAENSARPLLKIKLGGTGDVDRVRAVREGAPKAGIIVDANEGWSAEQYAQLAPVLLELGVLMVEQPFPAGADDVLADMQRPLPVCADESCHEVASLPTLRGKYDMVNIKLDKTGGLTEAIALQCAATEQGFKVMLGCMVGSSLAMAPLMLLAQTAQIIDLDGPLLLAEDRSPALHFEGSFIHPALAQLWG